MAQITLQSVAMMVATAAQVIAQMAHTYVQIHVQVVSIQVQQILSEGGDGSLVCESACS